MSHQLYKLQKDINSVADISELKRNHRENRVRYPLPKLKYDTYIYVFNNQVINVPRHALYLFCFCLRFHCNFAVDHDRVK